MRWECDRAKFDGFLNRIRELFGEKKKNVESYIYVDGFWQQFYFYLPRILYAKGLEKGNESLGSILLTAHGYRENIHNDDVSQLCDAFGILRRDIRHIYNFIPVVIIFLKWYILNRLFKKRQFYLRGIDVSKDLMDHMVRFNYDLLSFDKMRLMHIRSITYFINLYISANHMFKKFAPAYYLVNDHLYITGAIARLAENYGAQLICCTSTHIRHRGEHRDYPTIYGDMDKNRVSENLQEIDKKKFNYFSWAEEYYKHRKAGETDRDSENVYKNKRVVTKEEWFKESGADRNKKNIIIMLHVFSDGEYNAEKNMTYDCYYDWFISTMTVIQNVKNVNWIIRPHPSRRSYGEDDTIDRIIKKYVQNSNNIFFVGDDINGNSFYDIVDAVITVAGTCGLEFSSCGIPVVCAGVPSFYGGYGFTIDLPKADAYEEQLKHMDELDRLSNEQIDMAHKVSCAYFKDFFIDDFVRDSYLRAIQYDGDEKTDQYIDQIMKYDYAGKKLIDSEFYRMGSETKQI